MVKLRRRSAEREVAGERCAECGAAPVARLEVVAEGGAARALCVVCLDDVVGAILDNA